MRMINQFQEQTDCLMQCFKDEFSMNQSQLQQVKDIAYKASLDGTYPDVNAALTSFLDVTRQGMSATHGTRRVNDWADMLYISANNANAVADRLSQAAKQANTTVQSMRAFGLSAKDAADAADRLSVASRNKHQPYQNKRKRSGGFTQRLLKRKSNRHP